MGSNFKINWILNEEIAVGRAPQRERHLEKLSSVGIKSILSLCSEKEQGSKLNFSKSFHHKRFVLPDHKKGRVPTLEEINISLSIIKEQLVYGPVFVHCFAAVERSPLICMGWLIKEHKLSPQQALDYVMQSNPGTNPLPKQLLLLRQI